jgi:hypothetical protein
MHDLDDNLPPQIQLATEINPAHTSLAKLTQSLIAAEENSTDHRIRSRIQHRA